MNVPNQSGAVSPRPAGIETRPLRVLMITCEWPTTTKIPHAVPFIVRQVEFLRKAGF